MNVKREKKNQQQYIGETKRTFRERFKNSNRQRTIHSTAAVPSHLNQSGHSITDIELIPLELQLTLSMSRRKVGETYLINRGKTISVDGLNRKDER